MANDKAEKNNRLLAEKLSEIILREIEFKGEVLISVSRVQTTADLHYIKVFVDCFPRSQMVMVLKVLKDKKGIIRRELTDEIKFGRAPELVFFAEDEDAGEDDNEREVEEILHKLKSEQLQGSN